MVPGRVGGHALGVWDCRRGGGCGLFWRCCVYPKFEDRHSTVFAMKLEMELCSTLILANFIVEKKFGYILLEK